MARLKSSFESLPPQVQKKLQDLSACLKEVTVDKEGWCYKYRDKKELGNAIFKDFLAYNSKVMGKPDVFSFSEEVADSGILSQLQGFQVLATLIEDFDCDVDNKKILSVLDGILNAVGDKNSCRFDATPYLPNSRQFDKRAYIDSLTWFISGACSVFRLIIQKDLKIGEERRDRLVGLFRYCMDYLLKSFIDNSDNDFNCGWNYTEGCKQPSLYFTFAVSEVLIDIYSTFENVITVAEIELVQREIDKKVNGALYAEENLQKKQQIADINEQSVSRFNSATESIAREKELFSLINNGLLPYDNGSPYSELEACCKKAANCVWGLVKDKMAGGFFASDLVSDVTEAVIEQSITSDVLFNTLFVIGLVVNAGLDEDFEDLINYYTVNGSKEYEKAVDEYDEMRDILRLSYDNVYQMYVKLRKKGKEYKVNEYLLSFGEQFDESIADSAKEMRKARIRVFSLMPILVKLKTTLGEFVIRYPQYDMQLYLEQILERRYVNDDGETMWIWEREGYSSSSNYYYVSALSDFFRYYEEYELKYSLNAYKNEQYRRRIKDDYLEELRTDSGEIGKLSQELKASTETNEKLQAKIEELTRKIAKLNDDPLRKALNDFIYAAVQERISSLVADMFNNMAQGITEQAKKRAVKKDSGKDETDAKLEDKEESLLDRQQNFEKSLKTLGLSLISGQILEMLYKDKEVRDVDKELKSLGVKTSTDLEKIIKIYIEQVILMGQSDFVLTGGYRGIKGLLQEAQLRKDEQKNKRE